MARGQTGRFLRDMRLTGSRIRVFPLIHEMRLDQREYSSRILSLTNNFRSNSDNSSLILIYISFSLNDLNDCSSPVFGPTK